MSTKKTREPQLIIASSPHIRSHKTTTSLMADVLIALLPAVIVATIVFGLRTLLLLAISITTAVLAEGLSQKIMKRPQTIQDLSSIVTAVILTLNLPVSMPIWQLIFGTLFAIIVVKITFGGIGENFVNPAMTARIVLVSAFGSSFAVNSQPLEWAKAFVNGSTAVDTMSSATVLAQLKDGSEALTTVPNITNLVFGTQATLAIGETSAFAILIGAIYLLIKGVIKWHIPLAYISTVAALSFIYGGFSGAYVLYHLLSGGLLFGAVFMATDYATSPLSNKGKLVFGIGLGLITCTIRFWGNLPEGVSFSIIIMNILTPHIDRYTRTKTHGKAERKAMDIEESKRLVKLRAKKEGGVKYE